jgi:hypothetical protein
MVEWKINDRGDEMIEFYKENSLMQNCILKLNMSKFARIRIKPKLLNDYLCSKIVQFTDLYILNYYNSSLDLAIMSLQNNENKDDIESSLSKLHISDLIDFPKKKFKSIEYLRIGLLIAELLLYKLKSEFSNECFAIIVSFTLKGKFKDCVVSFHKVRDMQNYNEQTYYENFKNEALGIILTKNI